MLLFMYEFINTHMYRSESEELQSSQGTHVPEPSTSSQEAQPPMTLKSSKQVEHPLSEVSSQKAQTSPTLSPQLEEIAKQHVR